MFSETQETPVEDNSQSRSFFVCKFQNGYKSPSITFIWIKKILFNSNITYISQVYWHGIED